MIDYPIAVPALGTDAQKARARAILEEAELHLGAGWAERHELTGWRWIAAEDTPDRLVLEADDGTMFGFFLDGVFAATRVVDGEVRAVVFKGDHALTTEPRPLADVLAKQQARACERAGQ